jgi:hypothetical protein
MVIAHLSANRVGGYLEGMKAMAGMAVPKREEPPVFA